MEIRARHYYILINCVIFIPYLLAKPFSLNEAIAEEVRGKHSLDATSVSKSASTRQQEYSSPESPKTKQYKSRALDLPDNKISPLQYKRTFKIRTPLKPKRLKRQPKLRNKFKNKAVNRPIDSDEVFNSKYIPLLKSFSMLFDNILNSDTSESHETMYRIERNHRDPDDSQSRCACASRQKPTDTDIRTQETTTSPLATFTTKIAGDFETDFSAEITTAPAHNIALSNLRSFQRDKNLSVLFTRNTPSGRRDDNGLRKGSGTSDHGSPERNLSGDHGDNERDTGNAKDATDSQHYEEHTDSHPRNYAGRNESYGRISGVQRNPIARRTDKNEISAPESTREELGRHVNIFEGQNKFKARGHETEGAILVPNLDTGLRRHTIQVQADETESAVTHENREESNFDVTFDGASHKRLFSRDGSDTTENKEVRRTDETVNIKFDTSEPVKTKIPVVTIIDGYSIARDVNGENKLTEKTIHIHT